MDNIPYKHCNGCNKDKPITEFYKNRGHNDGLSSLCKICMDEKNRGWTTEHREKTRGYVKKWTDTHRDQERERLRQFKQENRERIREENRLYWSTRREEKREYDRGYYKKNADKKREHSKKHRAEYPGFDTKHTRNRRALKIANGGVITDEEWQEVLDKYGCKCLRCLRTDVKLSMDHVVPLSRGGKHVKENVQPLCVPCNSWKNTRIIDFRPF